MLDTVPGRASGLLGFLSLEELGDDLFRGWCHAGLPLRAFGGQVAAQALTAAGRTVPEGRTVHSLHGYFLRAGDTRRPLDYAVQRVRDGGSYLARQVSASQDGQIVFTLSASFKAAEDGWDRQIAMPTASGPEELPDLFGLWSDSAPGDLQQVCYAEALELRHIEVPPGQGTPGLTEQKLWIRAAGTLPDDPMLHACALAYASDLFLAPTGALDVERPRALRTEPSSVYVTSLDHAVWYHRPFRADDWLLFAQRSPTAADGRSLAFADVWSGEGQLVASVVQESVLRQLRAATP
ncbi:acyl-CoA thioesterase [Streptacidiphilus jiangxiensis]|uniref:Acyl-CoA thioesterase-2 n=1 Tax=Streptacidiphilus jiangxiensis TaxID=235985 RepID=A0A1H7T3Q1_STRJI|nr:acyl-CoA thioesterase II [Streptacidiphilus jiangxiensis]SEL79520.1 acyl-CoA thioesterase-2 [Streptacidiphilus jiangxiensis]